MACEGLRATVASLQNLLWALNAELATVENTILYSQVAAKISQAGTDLTNAETELEACLLTPLFDRPPGLAPRNLLEIEYANPALPSTVDLAQQSWTDTFVNNTPFPLGAEAEWLPVIDRYQQWDINPVGASGWVFARDFSSIDVPFTHPFGRDWEFYFAVDAASNAHAPTKIGSGPTVNKPSG